MSHFCNFTLPRTHFLALSLLLLLFSNAALSQSIHDGSFELPLTTQPAGDNGWTVCHGMPDVQVLDGNGAGIYGIHTPALQGAHYLGMLDTDFESDEAVGQAFFIEAGVHHYGQVGLFRSTAHHSWNGTAQLQLWGGQDCSDHSELLWSSGSVTNIDTWRYYPIQFAAMRNHAWLSLVVALDAGSGEMSYLCLDDFQLDKVFLAVEFVALEAQPQAEGMHLTWETAPLVDAERFEVEWSADGQNFMQIGELQGQAGQSAFEFMHHPAQAGSQYYRITAVDLGGHTTQSEIRQAVWANDALLIYPNPIRLQGNAGQVNVSLPATLSHVSGLRLLDLQGRVVAESMGPQAGLVQFQLPQLAAGCYLLQVLSAGGSLHQRLVVE